MRSSLFSRGKTRQYSLSLKLTMTTGHRKNVISNAWLQVSKKGREASTGVAEKKETLTSRDYVGREKERRSRAHFCP